jgi:3-phosphoshikimate 1-carboxyvinyltransferase
VSLPYVDVTERVLSEFGVAVRRDGLGWTIPSGGHEGRELTVEGDWSSASYLLAAAAITGGRVAVTGLSPASAQGDRRLVTILRDIGCEILVSDGAIEVRGGPRWSGFDLDLGDAPDLVPTVAVLAAFGTGESRIRGVGHLRYKESDRLERIAANLGDLGRSTRVIDDRIEIPPPAGPLVGARIRTAGDHRIAMAFAVVGLAVDGVSIDDPSCVAKSWPGFWDELAKLES